eukprot:610042-Alexandrium_andersonii.AAC.1
MFLTVRACSWIARASTRVHSPELRGPRTDSVVRPSGQNWPGRLKIQLGSLPSQPARRAKRSSPRLG